MAQNENFQKRATVKYLIENNYVLLLQHTQ